MLAHSFVTPDNRYHVESLGNGWAYNVTCQKTGQSFFVQDHDAEQLLKDSDYFECTNVHAQYMEALGQEY
jgi:nitrate reductase alpha subunit